MKIYELIDKHDGYWILDETGHLQGPYESASDAEKDIPNDAMLQYSLNIKYPTPIDKEPDIYDIKRDE